MTRRIIPKSPGAWARLCFSVAVLAVLGVRFHADAVVASWFYAKQEGDILFQSLPHGELVDAIEGITRSPWSHCGVLIQREGRWIVVEAIGEVRETPLKDWIVRSRGGRFAAFRVKGLTPADRERVKTALAHLIGRPYDFDYAPDDQAIYCSELAYKAYDAALQRRLGTWQRLGEPRLEALRVVYPADGSRYLAARPSNDHAGGIGCERATPTRLPLAASVEALFVSLTRLSRLIRGLRVAKVCAADSTNFSPMAKYIEMPKLSDTMTEGTLLKWRKKEGDKVQVGDILAEVETDKATMEMEAFDDGILHKFLVTEGSKVPIGGKLALVLGKGEQPPAEVEAPAEKPAPAPKESSSTAPAPSTASAPAAPAASSKTAKSEGGRVKASPLAKKIAAEKGVDLGSIQGSGPGGRIVRKDVEGPQPGAAPSGAAAAAPAAIASTPAGANDQRIPLSGMRRVIAERLLASKTQLPHFYLHIEVDAGPLMKARGELNAVMEATGGPKLTVNDFVLKAVVAAAVKVPAVNASFGGDAIIQYGSVNLSVAVAVEEGLVTPVIRDAQKKNLREISELVKDLANRARNKKLKPEEYAGGTITVSNLGAYGIESFSAIINPPQAMIVSVGAIVKKPVVGPNDTIVAGQRMSVGLSADHRVVDGAVGATYLAELRKLLENPTLMLL